jgi:hypothetical protein
MIQTIKRWTVALVVCAILAWSAAARQSLALSFSEESANARGPIQEVTQGLITTCRGVDDSATIREAISAARGNMITIPPGQTCALGGTTIANLRIMKGGLLKPTASTPVTISGVFEAGAYQVFTGSGSVIFAAGTVSSVNAAWFGDCAAEVGAPMNKAIRSIAAIGGRIELPSGALNQTVSINLTNIKNQAIKIFGSARGTIINAQLRGVAFDCTGSQFLELRDFAVSGNQSTTPSVAFLFARNSSHDSAGRNHLYNIETLGNFKIAALYNYSSEEFRAYDCYFSNSEADKPVVILTSDNVANLVSAYATIDTGPQSNLEIHFVGGAINHYGSGNSDSLVLRGASSVSFTNSFFVNNAHAFVHLDASSYSASNIDFRNITFDGNKTATYGFYVSGPKEIAHVSVENLLDYAIKPAARGGRTFYADNGTNLSFLSLKRLYVPAGGHIYTDVLTYSDVDAGVSTTLENHGYISNSLIRVASNKLILARPDLSLKNTILYIDTGTVGLTLPVYPNNRAAAAAGLSLGSLYRTGGDPDQVCVVH